MPSRFAARSRLLGPMFNARVGQWLQPSLIKSIQRGGISIGAGATSGTSAINAVVLANSVVKFLGYDTSVLGAVITENNCYIELTNATTVTATHQTAGNSIVASFEVIEYWPGVIKRVQRGLISIINGATTGTATITAVNTAKTTLDNLGLAFSNADATGNGPPNQYSHLVLTNATTITSTRIGTTDALTQSYQAVTWW